MCMVLYAASDSPLEEIAEGTPAPSVSVRPVTGPEELVRLHFTKPYAYFVGSHTGCSCGFQYGELVDEDEEGRESVAALGAFLAASLERGGTLELFSCRVGDEADAPTETSVVTPGDFTSNAEAFDLVEGWFATVVPTVS